ncbi:aa3-type cytochrome c oxidase subunit IV [Sphingomonas ginsenosidivorax]|uniref:Aa3-type cytochrome c oxidase subunit IV n=1 Tax=Sphingomonas ginsenosidivorax TaxID=862135 RepID=A0A5C6UKQ6_9SPHN|nr:aa3-type cytochrome c oxidase subunit IV [Sphingomonas ginsenosidivorax]
MNAHVTTYDKVIAMMKWGSVAVAIIAALVIWLIAH